LVAFVSGVMEGDVLTARKDAVDALSAASFLAPWAFEYTPASSDPVDDTYLRKVREADVVLWLVASRTTEPVGREIREALAHGIPLIVIRIESDGEDAATAALVNEVGLRAKWVRVPLHEVRAAVALSMADEIVRAWRDKPGRGRAAVLDHRGRLSRARCIQRWRAAGLTRAEALMLADDAAIGRPPDLVRPTAEQPLRVISADVGSGKSLCGERILQEAIASALEDSDAPIPVWLAAREVRDLLTEIESAAIGVGDLRRQGAIVVIDGADESTATAAGVVLNQARVAVETWPHTRIVITSRPLAPLESAEERVSLPLLDETGALSLVERISGARHVGYNWPASVRDAVRRPLFAILLGIWLRTKPGTSPRSTGEMLRWVLERALPDRDPAHVRLLRRLARLATDAGDVPIRVGDVADREELATLRESGLVAEHDGFVSLGLPILTQWFAAQSLATGEVTVGELIGNRSRLDLWRYALVMAVGDLNTNKVTELLDPLVRADPGFASEVLHEGLQSYGSTRTALPNPLEIGGAIRAATAAWLAGLGPVAPLLSFSRSDGTPVALGVALRGDFLEVMWRPDDDLGADVVELPERADPFDFGPGWGPGRGSSPGREAAWPWRWALDDVAADLGRRIDDRRLPVDRGPLFEEEAWSEALALLGWGSLVPGPVALDELEKRLHVIPEEALFGTYRRLYELRAIRRRVLELRVRGEVELLPPWPAPDKPMRGGWIWDGYSRERLLERTRAVCAGALESYTQLVDQWLPTLATRLTTYVTLPARFAATLHYNVDALGMEGAPMLDWHFEALPLSEQRTVEIELAEVGAAHAPIAGDPALDRAEAQLRMHRPLARGWIYASTHRQALDVFGATPATDVAYELLKRDLQRLKLHG
jgi:hypothetical protein